MINSFSGEFRFLSNFYGSEGDEKPLKIYYKGLCFDSVEVAYQAAKCANEAERKSFVGLTSKQSKGLGRRVAIRSDWDIVRKPIMEDLLNQKFSRRHPRMRQYLKSTGNVELIEGNYWKDTFWGVCNGIGENNLGKLEMKIRSQIIQDDDINGLIIAGTGHRPPKLFSVDPYGEKNFERLVKFATYALEWVIKDHFAIKKVISGMALGWDQALALAALDLRIPVCAAIPCKNQEKAWKSTTAQRRYLDILSKVDEKIYVTEGTYNDNPECMQLRNEWMVDHSDRLLALWDGSKGGTGKCVEYALAKDPKILINVWPFWSK